MFRIEQVTGSIAHHGEGPLWDRGRQSIVWLDMLAGVVHSTTESGETQSWETGQSVVALVRPRRDGGYVVAGEHDVYVADEFGGPLRRVAHVERRPDVRLNEGSCAPDGSLWIGSMAYDGRRHGGSLYRVTPDGAVTTLIREVTIFNGLGFADSGAALYVDSAESGIDILQQKGTGAGLDRSPFAEVDPADGDLDGLCIGADGTVWAAVWDGAEVRSFTSQGQPAERVSLPVRRPTACALGGGSGSDLYVTTSRLDLDVATGDVAGSLLRIRDVGAAVGPLWEFAG